LLWCLAPGGGVAVGGIPRAALDRALREASPVAMGHGGGGGGGKGEEGAWRGWRAVVRTVRFGGGRDGGDAAAGLDQARQVKSITVRLNRG
jgi:hypothetical protein